MEAKTPTQPSGKQWHFNYLKCYNSRMEPTGRKRLHPDSAPHLTSRAGDLHDQIAQHRQTGIIQAYLDFIAVDGFLAKTDAAPLIGRVKVKGARKQGPSAKDGDHASHSHPAAGWVSDFIQSRKKDIRSSQENDDPLTPHQQRFASFEESDLNNTFDDIRNTTESLPGYVNLIVDKRYEKDIRPLFEVLLHEVAKGTTSPEEAAEQFRETSYRFFETQIGKEKDKKLIDAFKAEKEGCLPIDWNLTMFGESKEEIQERALRRRRTD